jgi:hypothetical protein
VQAGDFTHASGTTSVDGVVFYRWYVLEMTGGTGFEDPLLVMAGNPGVSTSALVFSTVNQYKLLEMHHETHNMCQEGSGIGLRLHMLYLGRPLGCRVAIGGFARR